MRDTKPAPLVGVDSDRVRRIEATLAEITSRLGAVEPERHAPTPARDELSAAIADIAARQRVLDERPAIDHGEIGSGIAALRAELAEVASRIDLIGQDAVEEQESRIAIDRRIEALAAEGPLGRSLLGDIRAEIEALRAFAAVGAREATVIDGFEDLAQRVSDRDGLDALGEEIATLRQMLAADDSPRAVARLETRVSELARTIEATHNARYSAIDAANAGVAASLADIRGAIEDLVAVGNPYLDRSDRTAAEVSAGLAEIKTAIEARDRLAVTSESDAVARLESRLEDIAVRIDDVLGRTAPAEAISVLHDRLDGIAERFDTARHDAVLDEIRAEIAAMRDRDDRLVPPRLDHLEVQIRGIAARLDRPQHDTIIDEIRAELADLRGAVKRIEPPRLDHLEAQIRGIAERLDRDSNDAAIDEIRAELAAIRGAIENHEPPHFDLETQIRELAERLDTVVSDDGDSMQLADLEARVARLAGDLDKTMPAAIGLKQVEDDLSRLQASLSQTHEQSVQAARTAARDAIAEFSHPAEELTRSLRRDLETIRVTGTTSDHETRQTIQSLHTTLETVVERLVRIEHEARPSAPTLGAFPNPSAAPQRPANPPSSPDSPSTETRLPWSATTAGRRAPRADLGQGADRPLDADSSRAETLKPGEAPAVEPERKTADRRADFIAAARRAAQAAVAESGSATAAVAAAEADAEFDRPGAFARIGQAIRNRRKSLLLAAAAIVVAIGAIQIFGQQSGSLQGVADIPPAVESRAVAASSAPAPADTAAAEVGSTLVAPPANARAAMALAADDPVDERFGAAFAPPADGTIAGEPAASGVDPAPTSSIPVPPIGSDKLRAAASAGDPAAAFEIANRFAEGRDVERNLESAVTWYTRAAEGGVAVAQYRLASLYERGQGVPRDLAKAMAWYQRAVDLGNVGAMHNLAVLMSEGAAGSPDNVKALGLFLAAANYGVKDSQYNLGVIYARGLGQKPNLVESYKWFAVSAAQGDQDAATRRDEVAAMLKPDQLAAARAAVQAWRAKVPPAEANTVAAPAGGWENDGAAITEPEQTALVKKIQELLTAQGYDPGPADGVDGPKTREAVRAFQRMIGVAETGAIDGNLVAVLAER